MLCIFTDCRGIWCSHEKVCKLKGGLQDYYKDAQENLILPPTAQMQQTDLRYSSRHTLVYSPFSNNGICQGKGKKVFRSEI